VKEPERLAAWVRRHGGVTDVGGDLRHILGGAKYRPGLINFKGADHDKMTEMAWEAGYFPENNMQNRPTINEFLNAMEGDIKGHEPRYSHFDNAALEKFNEAKRNNSEIDQLAGEHGIVTEGMTREQFFKALAEKITPEQEARIEDEHIAEFDEAIAAAREDTELDRRELGEEEGHAIEFGEPRSLEDLENEYRSQDAVGPAREGLRAGEQPGPAGGRAEPTETVGGQGGRAAGTPGREAGEAAKPGAGHGTATGSEPGAEPLPALKLTGEPTDFRSKEDKEIEKAANIRLDKINSSEDMNDALRDLAKQNGDFTDARFGTQAYRTQLEIRNTRILLRSAASDTMVAAAEAAKGDPAAIAAWVTTQKRLAMIFSHLSTMYADWGHAGHELNRVMDNWDQATWLAKNALDPEGRDLFQLQQKAAALISKMENAEQAGKFAADMELTAWQKWHNGIVSLFVNNLISGPITHMAYSVGNEVFALFRAVPVTLAQATIGEVRQRLNPTATDRAYFGEVGAQLYGMMTGARDGVFPAWQAVKSGVPVLPEGAQGSLDLSLINTRSQAIPGKIGYAIETPSRVVAGIHTLFYTMNYEMEIARQAYRQASAAGLEGDAFNQSVAKFKASPPEAVMESASDIATRAVLMKRPAQGGPQQLISQIVNYNPPDASIPAVAALGAKLMVPFMQIGMNLLEGGLVDHTLVSLMQPEARAELMGTKGGAARDLRVAKIATGSMLAGSIVGLAAQNIVTGGGPVDPKVRRIMEDTGWKPYSIRIGDAYIPYRKYLGPLGPLVATSANFYEVGHTLEEKGATAAAASLAFGFSEVVADETWMAGVSNFVHAATDWKNEGQQYLRNTATAFIPFSVGLQQTARLVDPYQRQAHTLLETALNKIPFASENLTPQIGVWGQPITSHMMISPGQAREDPVDDRLEALDHGIAPIGHHILGVPLTEAQYTTYARIAGMLAHQRLMAAVRTPGFSSQPAEAQIKTIDDTVRSSREIAAMKTKMADQAQVSRERAAGLNPARSIIEQAMANKARLRGVAAP
jgi:hypothetical protein